MRYLLFSGTKPKIVLGKIFRNALFWVGPSSNDWVTELRASHGIIQTAAAQDDILDVNEVFEVVDLNGGCVYPSFRDGHAHPLFAVREHSGLKLTEQSSLDSVLQQVSDFRLKHPTVDWIDGVSFSAGLYYSGRANSESLDQVCSESAVVLHSDDRHSLWVNSAALRAAGFLDKHSHSEVPGIDRHEDGTPTGVLREWPAMNLVMTAMPKSTAVEDLTLLYEAERILINNGVCEVQDAWIDDSNSDTYLLAARHNKLRIKFKLAYRCTPNDWQRELQSAVALREAIGSESSSNVSVNAVKFFLDGSFASGSVSLLSQQAASDWADGQLLDAILQCARNDFQIHMHAIGDRAVRQALDAIEVASQEHTWTKSTIPVITHAELIADEDVARFFSLGVIASVQPAWAQLDSALASTLELIGPEAEKRMYRFRDLADANATLSFSSDWPVSAPNALAGLATAVTRQTVDSEQSFTTDQCLSMAQALTCATKNVATQLGSENSGSLVAGQTADFIVMQQNIFETAPQELAKVNVLSLYVAGNKVDPSS